MGATPITITTRNQEIPLCKLEKDNKKNVIIQPTSHELLESGNPPMNMYFRLAPHLANLNKPL